MRPQPAAVIGVLGAGTMGAGIAQLACRSGAQTLLHDPIPDALAAGAAKIEDGLAREASRGRISSQDAAAALERLTLIDSLDGLAPCELVIEAVPERPELKAEIYARLCDTVSEQCVLATNTSSMLVTSIAASATVPERVVGMHFFNPAPVMKLLEVVAGVRSSPDAIALAQATGEAMDKTVIIASDGPGFIVNRCNRPFGLEALRLLTERIADIETIDRICRMQGAFKMGPFELMDLVGVDTGFEVAQSFYSQSFGEPRWRPSPLTARYVAAGLHGRKSGRGYYSYEPGSAAHRPADPDPIELGAPPADGVVVISGAGALAGELRAAARSAGYEVFESKLAGGTAIPSLVIDCERPAPGDLIETRRLHAEARTVERRSALRSVQLVLCASGSLAALDPGGDAIGFHALPPLGQGRLVELTRGHLASDAAAVRAERFFNAICKHVAWVGDAPGLVMGRIVCQIINESAFALGEGVGSAGDIDLGMRLGLSHPHGPLEWADAIGLDHVLTVLQALSEHYREERYRPAPALLQMVATGRLGRAAGAGFFEYAD